MKSIIVYGGTFNPPHYGHINCVDAISRKYNDQKIILVPVGIPPHKETKSLATKQQRIDMLNLMFAGYSNVEICEYEMMSDRKSFTIDTIHFLKEKYSNPNIKLVIGSDMLMSFEKWYRYDEILQNVKLIVVLRDENHLTKVKLIVGELGANSEILCDNIIEISSTDIRNNIDKGAEITGMLPKSIEDYIHSNNMYLKKKYL